MKKYVDKKIIISGDILEVYEYENGYILGRRDNNEKSNTKSLNYEENRKKTLQRARANLKRIINSNIGMYGVKPKFLTLTFKENIQDLNIAHYEFKKFIQRVNYEIFKSKKSFLKYTAVVEFQKRGAIHYHVIFYNLPYITSNMIEKIWNNGFVKINAIDNVKNVGSYVTKYMQKSLNDKRLEGRKCYFNSKGLYKPIEITEKKQVEELINKLPDDKKIYSANYKNDYLGNIKYSQYKLK